MNLKLIYLLLTATFMIATAKAQNIPLDTTVRTGKLPNGFSYYIKHNQEPKNRVVFYLANKVGSLLENDDQQGLAHFTEHMSFNGTTHFPKNELVNYLQKSGVRFGADINAYTNFDETVYQLPLPANDPNIMHNGIEIMHDWAQGALFDQGEIDKERGVVLEEKRLGKGAADRMRARYFPIILNHSRYASRIPIGTEEVLKNFKPETIKEFYHDWYRPDLQAIIIVGDVDVDEMERNIKIKFADLKNPTNARERIKYTVPLTGKNQFIVVTDPEMSETSAEVMIKMPEVPLHTDADYRISILRTLYNSMMRERFADLQRQEQVPYLSGHSAIGNFLGGLDVFGVSVTAKPGELQKGFKAVWRESERARRFGFSSTEFSRAKSSYLNQLEAALKEKNKTASDSFAKEYLQYFLNGTAAPGVEYEYKLSTDYLSGIKLDELNAIAKESIKNVDKDVLILAPDKDKLSLPTEAEFNKWMSEVESENLLPFTDQAIVGSLFRNEPVAGSIVKEIKDEKLGISTLTLSNGIKVLLKPTNFKNNEVLFTGFAPGGTSLYSDVDFQSAAAANMVPSFGAGNYNSNTLSKYLTGKQLTVRLSIGERSQNINGGAVNKDLETALQLLYAYVVEPRKDSLLFNSIMSRSKASLTNRNNDPNAVFQDTVSAILGNYSVRRTGPSIEKLNQIDLNRAYSIFKERFANESGFNFIFVGNIDTAGIKPLLVKYIASLPQNGEVKQAKDLNIKIPTGFIEKKVYKGTEEKANVNLVFSGKFDYSFENKLKMDALKEILQIRLTERLREDESGVYSPSIRINTVKLPRQEFSAVISFGCAPGNVDKLIASALDEIEKIKTVGPTQLNLDKFKTENKRVMETTLTTNSFWLNYLSSQLQNGEKFDQVNTYTEGLDLITGAEIKSVARTYLTGKNYIKLVLLPEKK